MRAWGQDSNLTTEPIDQGSEAAFSQLPHHVKMMLGSSALFPTSEVPIKTESFSPPQPPTEQPEQRLSIDLQELQKQIQFQLQHHQSHPHPTDQVPELPGSESNSVLEQLQYERLAQQCVTEGEEEESFSDPMKAPKGSGDSPPRQPQSPPSQGFALGRAPSAAEVAAATGVLAAEDAALCVRLLQQHHALGRTSNQTVSSEESVPSPQLSQLPLKQPKDQAELMATLALLAASSSLASDPSSVQTSASGQSFGLTPSPFRGFTTETTTAANPTYGLDGHPRSSSCPSVSGLYDPQTRQAPNSFLAEALQTIGNPNHHPNSQNRPMMLTRASSQPIASTTTLLSSSSSPPGGIPNLNLSRSSKINVVLDPTMTAPTAPTTFNANSTNLNNMGNHITGLDGLSSSQVRNPFTPSSFFTTTNVATNSAIQRAAAAALLLGSHRNNQQQQPTNKTNMMAGQSSQSHHLLPLQYQTQNHLASSIRSPITTFGNTNGTHSRGPTTPSSGPRSAGVSFPTTPSNGATSLRNPAFTSDAAYAELEAHLRAVCQERIAAGLEPTASISTLPSHNSSSASHESIPNLYPGAIYEGSFGGAGGAQTASLPSTFSNALANLLADELANANGSLPVVSDGWQDNTSQGQSLSPQAQLEQALQQQIQEELLALQLLQQQQQQQQQQQEQALRIEVSPPISPTNYGRGGGEGAMNDTLALAAIIARLKASSGGVNADLLSQNYRGAGGLRGPSGSANSNAVRQPLGGGGGYQLLGINLPSTLSPGSVPSTPSPSSASSNPFPSRGTGTGWMGGASRPTAMTPSGRGTGGPKRPNSSSMSPSSMASRVLTLLKGKTFTNPEDYEIGWKLMQAFWGLTPADFEPSVLQSLLEMPVRFQTAVLLSLAAVDLRTVDNISAFLSCLIKKFESGHQVCLYFLLDQCHGEDAAMCPAMHPSHSPGWNLLRDRWEITFKDFDYAVLNFLASKPIEEREIILVKMADTNIRAIHNISAFLARIIYDHGNKDDPHFVPLRRQASQ